MNYPMIGSRQYRAALSELGPMMRWVREVLGECAPISAKARKFEVAIEEALVNVIHYAYPQLPGVVEIAYQKKDNKVLFTIKDKGVAFNPLENHEPINTDAPLEEREAGGLGIYFIATIPDSVDYQRADGWNVLTLIHSI